MTYFVVVVDDELVVFEPVSVLGEVDVADDPVELPGAGVVVVVVVVVVDSLERVLGDAEGAVRSRSVPPTRSLRSVQPASTPAPRASTQTPVNNLLIVVPPREIGRAGKLQPGCRRHAASCTLGDWRREVTA